MDVCAGPPRCSPWSPILFTVVEVGRDDPVQPGGVVTTIEAMTMAARITSPTGGRVQRPAIDDQQQLQG